MDERHIQFPTDLPIVDRREEIERAILEHQVLVIAGETGSGKTTQLPKMCLQLGRGSHGRIGHTQPRRLAARTVAQRIADELGEQLGQTISYQIRFTDTSTADTRVKLMTDGILLAEIQRDRLLRDYDTIIIDEAHERSLNIDFLLGYLKQLLPRRPDLKLIITSATIDVDSFSRHFDNAPIIEVSGRTYPVTTHYLESLDDEMDLNERIADAVASIVAREYGPPGDILVFLSGERDIRELAKLLRQRDLHNLEILPLYARLSQAEQGRVFQLDKRRGTRVVLATNVAETSITVPGIRYVVDPGYARISRYSYRSKIQRLPIEAISQASANQRQGRCGRVAEGVCLRLYSEQDFSARPEYTEPEIRRTNLASVILQMLRLKLGDLGKFPFLNPPQPQMVRDGYNLLHELGAVDDRRRLASRGRTMSTLPVDPRFSRMLMAASETACLREVLVITSALSVQDPRERPANKQQAADEKHRRFWHPRSDFMAWLTLWDFYEQQRQELSHNRLRKLCQQEFLSAARMREWRDIHFQLTVSCRRAGLPLNKQDADYETVHRALLSGLLSNLAHWDQGHEYRGSRNRKLRIFPGSGQFKRKPKWLMASEIVETSKVYAREVAAIEPQWALDSNPGLLKYHYYEPHWQARSGRVMAHARISLYGLTLVEKQRVHYGPVNVPEAREILVRSALVEGRVRRPPAFLRYNQDLVSELAELESKVRRRDILVDEQVLVDFYLQRLPDNITTMGKLQTWLKRKPGADQLLRMTREQLSLRAVEEELGNQFPDSLSWQDMQFPLGYHFEPGHVRDGVSVTIPAGLLNRVPRYRFQWLVPGLLREKCIHLVKGLPKGTRKQLVPVPDLVDRALPDLPVVDRPLVEVLGEALRRLAGVKIEQQHWDSVVLDDYYRMNYRVVDADGELIAQGRDLQNLLETCREHTRISLQANDDMSPATDNLTRWSIGDLPQSWRTTQAGVEIESYPALVEANGGVSVQLLDYPRQAEIAHRRGLISLYRKQCAEQVRILRRQLLRGNDFSLVLAGADMDRAALLEDLVDAAFARAILPEGQLPRTASDYAAALAKGRGELVNCGNEYQALLFASLAVYVEVLKLLATVIVGAGDGAKSDILQQTGTLFGAGFMRDTPFQWLSHYPRYIKAVLIRLQRLSGQYQKDSQHTELLSQQLEPLRDYLQTHPDGLLLNPQLVQYRWMCEELRVSLFAQALGTALPVSAKRLQEQWGKVAQWDRENPR